jgi:GT2 family glycosyltransferase
MVQPKITVVAYCGDHPLLAETLTKLAVQDAAPEEFEVVVIDYDPGQNWTQYTSGFAHRHPRMTIQYHRMENGTRARALNWGVKHASAPVVVLLADDFMAQPGLVSAHLKFHEENPAREWVGIGPGFFPEHLRSCEFRRWLEDSGSLFGISFMDGARDMHDKFFYVGNTSLKKAFFIAAGGLDEDFPYAAWEDYEMGLRLTDAGMRARFVAEATALHDHPVTLAERRAAMREAGASAVILERKHTGEQQWRSQCAQPPWLHHAKATYAGFKHHLTRNPGDLDRYYRKTLAASFVSAYRASKTC